MLLQSCTSSGVRDRIPPSTAVTHYHRLSDLKQNKSVTLWGFPGSSAGKESACNAGNPSLIPG